jgi:hypothetical protein
MIDIYAPEHRGALLPWESAEAFERLQSALLAEHAPQGPTETSLVERLAWIEQRRKRVRLAERAAHMASLAEQLDCGERTMKRAGVRAHAARERMCVEDVVGADPAEDRAVAVDHAADRKATAQALAALDRGGARAYERALALLHPDTRTWWEDGLAGEYGQERAWEASGACLAAFLHEEVAPADEALALAHQARGAVRMQALGESLDPDRIERLLTIEARLDRQFEKTLAVLIQLQQMRSQKPRLRAAAGAGRGAVRG